jgi:uncharacterized protein YdiU (UPF0061 family)
MIKLHDGFKFDNTFRHLPHELFEEVNQTPISAPKLVHTSSLKNTLGLDHLTDDELRVWLNGETRFEGDQKIATRYAGHQFGVWAGQLGDGRAMSLGEILTPQNERFEIQVKGSGLTPFSRMGDGKAVIRSSVREYLCSEAMFGLGIPTTRSLALLTGEDKVQRETIEHSALVARVFPTNIRFGHFEMCYHFEKKEALKELIEYTKTTIFKVESVEQMLKQVVSRTAILMAYWQDKGFCHGVMNTDNMSILGITIDYGPFGFLEDTVLNYICNHTDQRGRYAYNQQPSVAMWNLERLLVCFMDEVPKEKLEEILNGFVPVFETEYGKLCRKKLGLEVEVASDYPLFIELLKHLNTLSIDYTFFFRQLSQYQKNKPESLKAFWDYYGQRQEIKTWLAKYDERLIQESLTDLERSTLMKKNNPKFVLKNYIAQEIIQDVESGGTELIAQWLNVFYHPFDEHPVFEKYAAPTPSEFKHIEVSCSS